MWPLELRLGEGVSSLLMMWLEDIKTGLAMEVSLVRLLHLSSLDPAIERKTNSLK